MVPFYDERETVRPGSGEADMTDPTSTRRLETDTMTDFSYKGVGDYSLCNLLSRQARHELAVVCMNGLTKEYDNKPLVRKSRGRPKNLEAILAGILGVHKNTVARWLDPKGIHSSDVNSERLAELAYRYDPNGAIRVLRRDVDRHGEAVESWIREANNRLRVCNEIEKLEETEV